MPLVPLTAGKMIPKEWDAAYFGFSQTKTSIWA